jgi:hypothetical protein
VQTVKLLALAACVLSLALVAAGCGGDDAEEASSVESWAEELCTTTQDWADELQRIGTELGDTAASAFSRETIETAGDDASAATEDFVESLRDLGAPETESGDAVRDEIDELSDAIDAEREEIETAIDDLEGLSGIASAVGTVTSSLSAMGTAVQQTLEAVDAADASGELEEAFDNAPACQELRDSS